MTFSQAEIEAAMDKVCGLLPSTLKKDVRRGGGGEGEGRGERGEGRGERGEGRGERGEGRGERERGEGRGERGEGSGGAGSGGAGAGGGSRGERGGEGREEGGGGRGEKGGGEVSRIGNNDRTREQEHTIRACAQTHAHVFPHTQGVYYFVYLNPSPTQCDEFVEKYGDKIIDELLLGVLPKAVCTLIGLCVGESRVAAPASSIAASSIECVVCKEVLEYVKHLVGENATKVSRGGLVCVKLD